MRARARRMGYRITVFDTGSKKHVVAGPAIIPSNRKPIKYGTNRSEQTVSAAGSRRVNRSTNRERRRSFHNWAKKISGRFRRLHLAGSRKTCTIFNEAVRESGFRKSEGRKTRK